MADNAWWATRSRFWHILAVMGGLTLVFVSLVLNGVLPWLSDYSPALYQAYQYVIGPALLVLLAVYVERRSARPWVVAVGTPFLLWAVVSIKLGCPAVACSIPEGYQYWQNIKFTIANGLGGPVLLVSTEPGQCAFSCPYKIQVLPLLIGYGSLAIGLATPVSVDQTT